MSVKVASMITTSEPGIFFVIFGQIKIIARQTIAMIVEYQFIVENEFAYTMTFPKKSPGIFVIVREKKVRGTEKSGTSPKKSPICPVAIVTAIPAVKPVTIV